MSGLTDRIAEVLRATPLDMGPFLGGKGRVPDEWAAHVAERVAAELQLTEETRELTDGWIQPGRNAVYYAMGMEPPPAVITHERRWVSAWSEVQR